MDAAYDAFISYSHADAIPVARVHKFLEDFRLPSTKGGEARRLRVFRDQTDIRTGGLSDELSSALLRSSNLIVCCSASAAQSSWVRQEVEQFLARGEGQVIPILLGNDWESARPIGLQGRELRYADLRDGWRWGGWLRSDARVELIRVVATLAMADVRTFIPWELERRRRRRNIFSLVIVIALLILGGAAAGWQLELRRRRAADALAASEAKRAQLQQLQRRGESALASARTGDIAGAVALLERVVSEDKEGELPGYRVVHRFLRPLLTASSELLAKVPRSSLFRWRGKDYILFHDGTFRSLSTSATELYAIVGSGRYLVTISAAREVNILTFPALTPVQQFTVDDVRFLGIYEHQQTRALSFVAKELALASDEDSPDAQQEMGTTYVMLSAPTAKHQIVSRDSVALTACGARKDEPCGFKRVGQGPEAGIPALAFPQVRDEKHYWRVARREATNDGLTANLASLSRIDFSAWRCPQKEGNQDFDCTPEMVNPQFFELDGIRYLSGDVVTGNQSVSLHFCRVSARNTVDTCWQVNRTAASRTFFSPGFRNLLIAGPEVYADSFRVFEFTDKIRACSGFENPGERVIDIAFHPAGKRVAVASRQGEVWIYSLEPGCRIVLQRKIFNANLAQWAAGARNNTGHRMAVHFPTARVLLLTHGTGEIIAMDPETGLLKWSQSGRHAANRFVSAATAANDGATLAVWGSRHIQLMHAETGTMLSGVMQFPEPGKMGRGLARVKWLSGDALEAEWETSSASDGTGQRIFYRRLGPDEAAAAFVHGVSTESLTGYSNAVEHTPLAELR